MKSDLPAPQEIVAQLVAEAVRKRQGAVGVLIRDVPHIEGPSLLSELATLEAEGIELRVALLQGAAEDLASAVGFEATHFSIDVEQAEKWRNDRGLSAIIVVVATGDEAKLTSLEEFDHITSRNLKAVLIDRALGEKAGANEVQSRWWRLLGDDDTISLGQLVDYYLSLFDLPDAEFVTRSAREVHRLSLLPDPALFNDPNEKAVARRVGQNRDLVRRLQTLSEKDRKTIASNIATEDSKEKKKILNAALRRLRELRWGGQGLAELNLDDAQGLLGIRKKKAPPPPPPTGDETPLPPPPPPPPEKALMREMAAEALINDTEDGGDLDAVIEQASKDLAQIDESQLRPEKVVIPLQSGITVHAEARSDVINVVVKLIGEGVYGGLISTEGTALEDMLRRFQADQDVLEVWTKDRLTGFFDQLDHPSIKEMQTLFLDFDEKRNAILPLTRLLAVEPLAVAAAPAARAALLDYVKSYHVLLKHAHSAYGELFEEFGSDTDELLAHLLALETIVFRSEESLFGLVSPTHPLYLWHYSEYCRIVDEQTDLLSERDKALVVQAAQDLPNFLTSLCVPHIAADTSRSLPQVGRLGPLPYYGPEPEVGLNDDGVKAVARLIRSFVNLYPPAKLGFRLALLDPPDAGSYLSLCCDLAEEGVVDGAHVLALRHPARKIGVELRLTPDEEDRVALYFRSVSDDRRFVFDVRQIPADSVALPDNAHAHLMVAFDQTPGKQTRTQPAAHPIQPLALTRRLKYKALNKTVELEPAPGGVFAAYNSVVGHFDKSSQTSYFVTHQQEDLRTKLEEAARKVPWYVVADRNVDRDLQLVGLRVFTTVDGERDVAAFTGSTDAFRRALREVAREYNTAISEEELDGLLFELSELLDAGVLALTPDDSGKVNFSGIKGLLGTLIAARWFRSAAEEAHDRLLVSLDSQDARRWLHLSDDPLRADLLGIDAGDEHFTISIVEVKAVKNSSGEYTVAEGIASGPAINQMLSTRRLIAQVFTGDRASELITTPARREVIREHIYRELSKTSYSPEKRKAWVDRLERLFDEEDANVTLRCHLVEVRLGVDSGSLENRDVRAREDSELIPVSITELNESGVEALQQKVPLPEPPKELQADEVVDDAPQDSETTVQSDETGPIKEPVRESSSKKPVPVRRQQREAVENRPRAFLGEAPGSYGKPREVWFDPGLPRHALPNPHISISGETGSGKTQVTKAIIRELSRNELPTLVLDFKDDYAQEPYVTEEGFDVYDASYGGLPFNPMVPPVDRQSGRVSLVNHIHQLGEIVKRIYELGDQQAFRFREALKEAYTSKGLTMKPFVAGEDQEYPTFDSIEHILRSEKDNETVLGRLSPIFDLGLFSSSAAVTDFAQMADKSTVIRLSQLPGDEVKNAVAEFFLMALYNHLIRLEHPHSLQRLLVLDEAWRLVKSPFLEPLMREGRAFGLGVVLATQYPKDLPDQVAGATATKFFFSQTNSENIREIQRSLVGKTSGADAEHLATVLRQLPPLTCLLQNNQYTPYVRLAVVPYFERVTP